MKKKLFLALLPMLCLAGCAGESTGNDDNKEKDNNIVVDPNENKNEPQGCEHSYGDWVATENGHERVCSKCNEKDTQSGAHSFIERVLVPSTYDSKGSKQEVCSVCGYEKNPVETEASNERSYALSDNYVSNGLKSLLNGDLTIYTDGIKLGDIDQEVMLVTIDESEFHIGLDKNDKVSMYMSVGMNYEDLGTYINEETKQKQRSELINTSLNVCGVYSDGKVYIDGSGRNYNCVPLSHDVSTCYQTQTYKMLDLNDLYKKITKGMFLTPGEELETNVVEEVYKYLVNTISAFNSAFVDKTKTGKGLLASALLDDFFTYVPGKDGDEFILSSRRIMDVVNYVKDNKICDVIDYVLGEGSYEKIADFAVNSIEMKVGDVIDALEEKGITSEGLLEFADGLVNIVTLGKVDSFIDFLNEMLNEGMKFEPETWEEEGFLDFTIPQLASMLLSEELAKKLPVDLSNFDGDYVKAIIDQFADGKLTDILPIENVNATFGLIQDYVEAILSTFDVRFLTKKDGSFDSLVISAKGPFATYNIEGNIVIKKGYQSKIDYDGKVNSDSGYAALFAENFAVPNDAEAHLAAEIQKNYPSAVVEFEDGVVTGYTVSKDCATYIFRDSSGNFESTPFVNKIDIDNSLLPDFYYITAYRHVVTTFEAERDYSITSEKKLVKDHNCYASDTFSSFEVTPTVSNIYYSYKITDQGENTWTLGNFASDTDLETYPADFSRVIQRYTKDDIYDDSYSCVYYINNDNGTISTEWVTEQNEIKHTYTLVEEESVITNEPYTTGHLVYKCDCGDTVTNYYTNDGEGMHSNFRDIEASWDRNPMVLVELGYNYHEKIFDDLPGYTSNHTVTFEWDNNTSVVVGLGRNSFKLNAPKGTPVGEGEFVGWADKNDPQKNIIKFGYDSDSTQLYGDVILVPVFNVAE